MTTQTALDVLRQRTRAGHEALDAAMTGADGQVGDRSTYLRLLTTLSHLHARTDGALREWAVRSPLLDGALAPEDLPHRAHLYAADLAALGEAGRAAEVAGAVPDEAVDDAAALAYLYVVAGSTKGARVVLHGMPDDLAPEARAGLEDAAGRPSARLWQGCRAVLTTPLPDDLVERAAAEAERLFALLLEEAAA